MIHKREIALMLMKVLQTYQRKRTATQGLKINSLGINNALLSLGFCFQIFLITMSTPTGTVIVISFFFLACLQSRRLSKTSSKGLIWAVEDPKWRQARNKQKKEWITYPHQKENKQRQDEALRHMHMWRSNASKDVSLT